MLDTLSLGQIVYSKCGRDRGRSFIIYDTSEDYVYLVDGDLHKLSKPKKKKEKHVQKTSIVIEDIKNKLMNKSYILDADIRKVLLSHKEGLFKSNKEVKNLV
jgi:ribosomal protein L14E/L6E/L27E